MESLIQLYTSYAGTAPKECNKIAGGGSNRQYFRLCDEDGNSVIGAKGTSFEENGAFIYLSRHFSSKGLPVPQILAVSDDGMSYLQTDLGRTNLYEAIKTGREDSGNYSEEEISLLRKAICLLPKIQVCGAIGLDFSKCYPQESMNEQNVMFDLNYFKYCFLKTTNIDFNEVKLEECFKNMAQYLGSSSEPYFMFRDFQARNLMLCNGNETWAIDYQGGRRGPLQYDLVSFLWQSSSHFSSELRTYLINEYISALKKYVDIDELAFKESLSQWVLFRILQVLGAYGYRGRYEKKKYFLDSIPAAITNLREILAVPSSCPYPYLYKVLNELTELEEFKTQENVASTPSVSKYDNEGSLKVRVYSFSYKKGIPEDTSGNGGGYVFDCRATHNPGRYELYKTLTGLDKPVMDFLEEDGEILHFLKDVYSLADVHVKRYMERGFTSLMFSFGCTGGQHRSVYSAQHLAEYIHEKFGIEVSVIHREQKIEKHYPARKKAMIFAAGLGTRLRPLTDNMPKALVKIKGKPLIEHVLEKLVFNGFNDIVVNVHHFADMIEAWSQEFVKNDICKDHNVRISFSDERNELLETGGGIANAKNLLKAQNPDQGFLVHNVDIFSNVDLQQVIQNSNNNVDAVLIVSKRATARYFVFDNNMRLVGWTNIKTQEVKSPYLEVHEELSNLQTETLETTNYKLRAFAGIHYLKNNLFDFMDSWPRKFSITDFYINMCDKLSFKGFEPDNLQIFDVGKIDSIGRAETFVLKLQE